MPFRFDAVRDRSTRPFCVVIAALGALASACGPAAGPTPAPVPTPVPAASTPAVSQACPDPADGPSIVIQAVEDARGAMAANPTGPLPPACIVTAFVRIPVSPDTVNEHALGIAAALDARGVDARDVLPAEITLLARAHRYADVSRVYARLVAISPQPPIDAVQLAIVAARQRADTASLIRLLIAAEARSDAPPAFHAERVVVQQAGALQSAIAEARGFIRQNPKNLGSYPSLIANFGTLGNADSVATYIGRAERQGVARAALTADVDPFVNTVLRQASLYGAATGWDRSLASATRVDAALSTPSTKLLLASLLTHAAEGQIDELGPMIERAPVAAAARSEWSRQRTVACGRIPSVVASIDAAAAHMRAGGDRSTGGNAPAVSREIESERARLDVLRGACAR